MSRIIKLVIGIAGSIDIGCELLNKKKSKAKRVIELSGLTSDQEFIMYEGVKAYMDGKGPQLFDNYELINVMDTCNNYGFDKLLDWFAACYAFGCAKTAPDNLKKLMHPDADSH